MTFGLRGLFAGMTAGLLGLAIGCNPGAMSYFLLPEQRMEAKMKHLASDDEKKEPRVAILCWAGLDIQMRSEYVHVDRQLADLLARQLKSLAEASKEKLSFVPARQVEAFKSQHENWRSMSMDEVGRKFDADYVIYLEINSLSMYEGVQLLRGRANITVQLIDVHKPDDAPISETFTCVYPGEAPGAMPVDLDTQPHKFRHDFLTHMARQLAYYFSKYPRSERYRMD